MKPNIIISTSDIERLEDLLDHLPGAAADVRTALLAEIARAEIVEPEDVPSSVVTMNSRVRFAVDPSTDEFSLTLSYPKEVREGPERISVLSPVGMAILGLSVGDAMHWPGPDGVQLRVRILDVLYQPESNDRSHAAPPAVGL